MDGNLSDIDVIIIGAGPAGTAAAIWCAKNKLGVLVIEWKEFPRHKPGETLHPGISTLFEQLGVKNEVELKVSFRHRGYTVASDVGSDFIRFSQEDETLRGFQILRDDLDNILLQRAKKLNVRIIQPCRALSVIKKGERVTGINTSKGIFFAKFIIDATGTTHWIAKQLGLEIKKYSIPLLVKYGYSKGTLETNKFSDPVFSFEKNGWLWSARIGKDIYHWTRLVTDNNFNNGLLMPPEYYGLQKIGPVRSADVTWRRIAECAGKGYFLIGDAAIVFDPSASKGVLRGIYSGIMAGHSILQLFKEQSNEIVIINGFKKWMKEWFYHDLKIMREFYSNQNIYIGVM